MTSTTQHPAYGVSGKDSLRKHGRSFYWAGKLLSGKQLARAAALYGLCRDIDDLADNAVTPSEKSEAECKLANLEAFLTHGRLPNGGTNSFLVKTASLFSDDSIAIFAMRDMVRTIRKDLQPVNLKNHTELRQYAYGAAGTVGVMMACILEAKHRHRAFRHAIDLGIGMQLTNIARDVLEDAHLGRVYLPAEGAAGKLTPQQIIGEDPTARSNAWQGVREILLMAEAHYQSGWDGLGYLPLRPRISIAVAARVYRQIGRQILKRGEKVYWHRRSVVGWQRKLQVSLRAFLQLILKQSHGTGPDHQPALHEGLETCLNGCPSQKEQGTEMQCP